MNSHMIGPSTYSSTSIQNHSQGTRYISLKPFIIIITH